MHNEGRLYSQVAAQAGVTAERAMIACYLLNLSRDGKSMDEAAHLLRKSRADVRDYARDWGIPFSDYRFGAPLYLRWEKEKRGRWLLKVDGLPIAEAISDGSGGYEANRLVSGLRSHVEAGSTAEVAMRRLSMGLERDSVSVFGVDDVVIEVADSDGDITRLAPKTNDDQQRLRMALATQ